MHVDLFKVENLRLYIVHFDTKNVFFLLQETRIYIIYSHNTMVGGRMAAGKNEKGERKTEGNYIKRKKAQKKLLKNLIFFFFYLRRTFC